MTESLVCRQPAGRLPLETPPDEVDDETVLVLLDEGAQDLLDVPGGRGPPAAAPHEVPGLARGAGDEPGAAVPAAAQQRPGGRPQHLHHQGQLVLLVPPGQQGLAHHQLRHEAAEAPDVHGGVVAGRHLQDHLRGPVEPALDVAQQPALGVAAGAEVDQFDARQAVLLQQDVFRLQIAVNDLLSVDQTECYRYGVGELPHHPNFHPSELVLLDQLEQVQRHQLEDDAHVPTEYKVVLDVDHVGCVAGILAQEMFQDFNFPLGLVQEPFIVPDDLQSSKLSSLVVVNLQHLAEGPFPEDLEDLVPVADMVVRKGNIVVLHVVKTKVPQWKVARDLAGFHL